VVPLDFTFVLESASTAVRPGREVVKEGERRVAWVVLVHPCVVGCGSSKVFAHVEGRRSPSSAELNGVESAGGPAIAYGRYGDMTSLAQPYSS